MAQGLADKFGRLDYVAREVVKANGYGLGAGAVAQALAKAGARRFFVAVAEEGAAVRKALGPGPASMVFSGHMSGDTTLLAQHDLTPMINSVDQLLRHVESLPGRGFGLQLDTGMNRLGIEPDEWAALRDIARGAAVSTRLQQAERDIDAVIARRLGSRRGRDE